MAHEEPRFRSKEDVLELAGGYGDLTLALVEGWLTPRNTKQAARDWDGFARVVESAGNYKQALPVFAWLGDQKRLEQAAKDWGGFAELVEYAGKYGQAVPVLKWLENQRYLENAAKNWTGFARLLEYMKRNSLPSHPLLRWLKNSAQLRKAKDWGGLGIGISISRVHKQEDAVFKWLEIPANLEKAVAHGDEFGTLVNRIGASTRVGIILCLLTVEDAERTAKNWADFSGFKLTKRNAVDAESDRQDMMRKGLSIVDSRNRERDNKKVEYNSIVFDWIEDPANLKQPASNWGYVERSKQELLEWLGSPERAKQAAADWGGFASIIRSAKDPVVLNHALKWLENPKNLGYALKNWRGISLLVGSPECPILVCDALNWLEDPAHRVDAEKDWGGFASLVHSAKDVGVGRTMFGWLEDKRHLEAASKNWRGLAMVVRSVKGAAMLRAVLAWLDNPLNMERAAKNWRRFATFVASAVQGDAQNGQFLGKY